MLYVLVGCRVYFSSAASLPGGISVVNSGVGFFWYDIGTAGHGHGCALELERGACGEEKEAGLGLGSTWSYVVDLVRAKSSYI